MEDWIETFGYGFAKSNALETNALVINVLVQHLEIFVVIRIVIFKWP